MSSTNVAVDSGLVTPRTFAAASKTMKESRLIETQHNNTHDSAAVSQEIELALRDWIPGYEAELRSDFVLEYSKAKPRRNRFSSPEALFDSTSNTRTANNLISLEITERDVPTPQDRTQKLADRALPGAGLAVNANARSVHATILKLDG